MAKPSALANASNHLPLRRTAIITAAGASLQSTMSKNPRVSSNTTPRPKTMPTQSTVTSCPKSSLPQGEGDLIDPLLKPHKPS